VTSELNANINKTMYV